MPGRRDNPIARLNTCDPCGIAGAISLAIESTGASTSTHAVYKAHTKGGLTDKVARLTAPTKHATKDIIAALKALLRNPHTDTCNTDCN